MREPERKGTNEPLVAYVRRVMDEKGLSQRDVSNRARGAGMGLSHGYVAKFLLGEVASPTLDRLAAFAVGIGVDPLELCRIGLGYNAQNGITSEVTQFGHKLVKLKDEDKEYFRRMIKSMDSDADRLLTAKKA